MPRKIHKPEEIVAKLRQVDVLTSQGVESAAEAIPLDLGSQRGDVLPLAPGVRRVEDRPGKAPQRPGNGEHPVAPRGVGPDTGQADPAGGGTGKLLEPRAPPCACIEHVRDALPISERRACAALGQHRSTQRKIPHGREDEARLTADIVEDWSGNMVATVIARSPSCCAGPAGWSTTSGSSGSGDARG